MTPSPPFGFLGASLSWGSGVAGFGGDGLGIRLGRGAGAGSGSDSEVVAPSVSPAGARVGGLSFLDLGLGGVIPGSGFWAFNLGGVSCR